jgi:hypothetical protein
MTLHTMSIPDEPSELPRWLEGRLMAPDFGRFVSELLAHFPTGAGAALPRPLFEQWLPVAIIEGLEPIPPEVLTQLLKHPASLAAFQEQIVTDGGPYWDEVIERSQDLTRSFNRGQRSLDRILSVDAVKPNRRMTRKPAHKVTARSAPKAVRPEVAKRTGGRRYKIWAFASSGIAACLAVAVGLLLFRGPDEPAIPKSQVAWGWGKPSGLAANESSTKGYLNKLAANAEEWFQYQPSDAAGVGTRIAELRIGCTRLMNSAYGPLAAEDKAWLLEHCRAWARAFDGHQQALDTGADPLVVRAHMDETVRSIAFTLREKAEHAG